MACLSAYHFPPYSLNTFCVLLSIVHRIIIFETSEVANTAFDKTLTQRQGTEFHVNQGLDVTKDKSYANNIAWGCDQSVTTANSQFTISTRYCITVATYQNVYVEIRGQTFTNEYLTMEKYFDLVKQLDQRVGEVLKISKPE